MNCAGPSRMLGVADFSCAFEVGIRGLARVYLALDR